ncbi:hypothetical protein cypCar_00042042 [Cyprinus carpio]|nr:hypothetical protein cypCar_00042042 [Cyprinus carpio]
MDLRIILLSPHRRTMMLKSLSLKEGRRGW